MDKCLREVSTDRPDRPVPPETEPVLAQVATDRLNPMEALGWGGLILGKRSRRI